MVEKTNQENLLQNMQENQSGEIKKTRNLFGIEAFDDTAFQFGGDEKVSIELFNNLSNVVLGKNTTLENKVKFLGHFQSYLDHVQKVSPDDYDSQYSNSALTIREAAESFNPKFVKKYLKESTNNSKEYKDAFRNWTATQLTEDGLFVPSSDLKSNKTQDFVDKKKGYYVRSRQDIQDAGRVILKGGAAVGASVADLTDLAAQGLDYTIGKDNTDYIRKGFQFVPLLGDAYNVSKGFAKVRDSEFLEYKGQLSQKPRLAATIDFVASLPGFSKVEKIIELGALGAKATKYGAKSKELIDSDVFKNIDKAIDETKDNLLGRFKKKSLQSTKTKLGRYSTLGANKYKQELDKKHNLINLGLSTFWAGGQALWGGEKEEGAFWDFNNNPTLQIGVGILGVTVAPQLMKSFTGGATDLVKTIENAVTPNQTKRESIQNFYNMSKKDIDKLKDSEIDVLHAQTNLQNKATQEFIERMEYDRLTRPDVYKQNIGLLTIMKNTNDEIKEMSLQMYKQGKSGLDDEQLIELANLRAEHVLMSDVIAGVRRGVGRLDQLPLSGKLPKEFNLQSEIEQIARIEANIRQTEVDALNFIMPTRGGSTKTLGAGSELMQDIKSYHQRRLNDISKQLEDIQIAREDNIFKTLAKSKTRDDYYEGTISEIENDPLSVKNPEFTTLRKEFLDDTAPSSKIDLDVESQSIIKSLKDREVEKFSKMYNTVRGTFGKETVNLEDDNLTAIFASILERGGKSPDIQIPDAGFAEYSGFGLATPEGIGQKGFSKSNVKKIYKDASKELVWKMEGNGDLNGLRKLYRDLEASYDLGDTDIRGFSATRLATELDNLISSGKTTDGEISLHAIHTWKSDAFESAIEASAANNKKLAKSYFETANDLNLILETATESILRNVDTTPNISNQNIAGRVLSRDDIVDSILTYRKADKEYFENYVVPFKQGIGGKIIKTDSSGDFVIAPENIFQQFIKANGHIRARKNYNEIFKNATEKEIETGKNLLMENVRKNVINNEHIPDDFLDNFEDLLGQDNVSKVRRIQDGYDLHYSSIVRKQSEGKLTRDLKEIEAGLGPDIDALNNLRKNIVDEDPTKIFEIIKNYEPKNLTKLIDGLTETRFKRKGNDMSKEEIMNEVKQDLLGVSFDGIKQQIIKLQDGIGGLTSTSDEGFKKFLQRSENLDADDVTENYFRYLEELDGKVSQTLIADTKRMFETLGGSEHVRRLESVLGQTKVRSAVEKYVGEVGGVPAVVGEAYFFGRSYNAVKGHLSYRYLITEAVLKTIRKKRVDLIAEMVTNPNAASSIIQGLYSPNPSNRNLKATAKWLRMMYALPEDTTDDEIKDGIKELPPTFLKIPFLNIIPDDEQTPELEQISNIINPQ